MLTSLALIFVLALILGSIFTKLRLPSLLGMLLTGIILGPSVFNLIDGSLISISAELRQIALVIILIRAGLSIDTKQLKKSKRPALFLCFVPAVFEIGAVVFLAPLLLGISYLEAAIAGSVLAAVSPAVVVPRMLTLMNEGYGENKNIPQMIMASASVDDVFVIVLFTSFVSLGNGGNFSISTIGSIPFSILTGIIFGFILGSFFARFWKKVHMRDSVKVLILLALAFLLLELEKRLANTFPFSSLLAIMSMSMAILKGHLILAKRLSEKFSKIWIVAEVLLFVLVGASVPLSYAKTAGALTVVLIFIALAFRIFGVFVSLLKTNLTLKERLFCALAYLPKASVQAAIGGVPLALGLSCGNIVLTLAVLSILITAPLGAFAIDLTYKKLLNAPKESD